MPDQPDLASVVRERLNEILDPCSVGVGTPVGLTEMGLVKDVEVSPDGDVHIDLRLTSPTCNMLGFMAEEASRRVRTLPGVRSVEVVADTGLDWSPSMMTSEAQERRKERLKVLFAQRDERLRERRELRKSVRARG